MQRLLKDYPFRSVLSLKPLIDYLNQNTQILENSPFCLSSDLRTRLEQAEELHRPIEDPAVLDRYQDLVKALMGLIFPVASWETEAIGALVPFSVKPFFVSPRFKHLFLDQEGDLFSKTNLTKGDFNKGRIIRAYLFILERFYDIHQEFTYPLIRIVRDPETGLDRYFKMHLDFRFVQPHAVREPKRLSDQERALILDHLTEPEILRRVLPPEDFELHGFVVIQGVDVTDSELLSALERDLIDQESIVSRTGFLRVQERLQTLFRRPDLVAGLDAIQEEQVLQLSSGCEMSHCCIFADTRHVPLSEFEGTVYERAVKKGEVLRIPDILEEPSLSHKEKVAHPSQIRSLLIAPLFYKDQCIGTLHVGTPRPGDLGPMDALLITQIQPLFSMAIKRALDDLENRVQGVIKEKCTAIHPSVEWRFRRAALRHLENLRMGRTSDIESIVFKDVYPLYGISDVRGSTSERNHAIQQDLTEHLTLALNVINLANVARPLLVLQELAGRVKRHLARIRSGLATGDEVAVTKFIREEVEPSFSYLKGFGPKVVRAIEAYESAVDPNVGTVYRLRREFEESVATLNEHLATYLDQEEAQMQAVFPHYFERHRSDGVDYIIYMGASLTERQDFNRLFLRNARIWQLKVAAGMAWQTEQLKSSLKVPLDTAHLVLVQESPLSVRFRFDEKRFDVDGAYDIRHEIIKSRLDKAVVKGRRERLTQPGRIAVVYSSPEEAHEALQHIEFLQSEGYLTREIEKLDLEDLPGVQGLKSLRIEANLKSSALSKRMEQMVG